MHVSHGHPGKKQPSLPKDAHKHTARAHSFQTIPPMSLVLLSWYEVELVGLWSMVQVQRVVLSSLSSFVLEPVSWGSFERVWSGGGGNYLFWLGLISKSKGSLVCKVMNGLGREEGVGVVFLEASSFRWMFLCSM